MKVTVFLVLLLAACAAAGAPQSSQAIGPAAVRLPPAAAAAHAAAEPESRLRAGERRELVDALARAKAHLRRFDDAETGPH
jgi:hypothetical protein